MLNNCFSCLCYYGKKIIKNASYHRILEIIKAILRKMENEKRKCKQMTHYFAIIRFELMHIVLLR